MKRFALALGGALLCAALGAGLYANAARKAVSKQTDAGVTLTGCLSTGGGEEDNGGGQLRNVAVGPNPTKPCKKREIVVHLGSGDITSVNAGTGLTGGAASGDASLAISPSYQLPQGCAAKQAPQASGAAWQCGTFAGAGQNCQVGSVVAAIDAVGAVSCADPLAGLSVSPLASGDAHCATGGVGITVNGQASYVCNGEKGPAGVQGDQGPTGPTGPQGPAGGANNMSSANGEFSVEITDLGIFLHGPTGTLVVDTNGSFFSPDRFYGG